MSNDDKEVLFTIVASINGEQLGGRYTFFASDIEDFTQECEGTLYDYADTIFDEVETHECD